MSTATVPLNATARPAKTRGYHAFMVAALACGLLLVITFALLKGVSYYRLPLSERSFNALHRDLRPSGQSGIRMGLYSIALFGVIYLYPLRKKWKWLSRVGRTKHWLDFHIVMGLCVPVIVAIHAAFKFGGIAGMAYWMMVAVVMSGIAGRYLYAQIPRSQGAAELTLAELEHMSATLAAKLKNQSFPELDLNSILHPVDRDKVMRMPLWKAMGTMFALDLKRPFQMAALRRRILTSRERLITFGGLTASGNQHLEQTVDLVRRQAWLAAKICLLQRAAEVFQLWHVVHRPFSYAFLVLVTIHVGMVMLMGYF